MNLSVNEDPLGSEKSSIKGMFASLFFRDFRLIWFSGIAGLFAMNMQIMARGWLIYDITGSAMDLTWVWVILTHSQQATSLLPMSQTTSNDRSIDNHYNLQISARQPHLFHQLLCVYEIQSLLEPFGRRPPAQTRSA